MVSLLSDELDGCKFAMPVPHMPLAAPLLRLSGSDLKNLCIAAAYCPIREHLEAERAAAAAAKAAAAAGGPAASASAGDSAAAAAAAAASSARPAALAAVAAHVVPQPVRLRSINIADFKAALKQVGGPGLPGRDEHCGWVHAGRHAVHAVAQRRQFLCA